MPVPWRRSGPEAERPVDVHPRAAFVCAPADLDGRIECAGIHVASLNADDGASVEIRQRIRAHPALSIDSDALDTLPAQSQQPQRFQQRDMYFVADDDAERRRLEEPGALDVPAGAAEQRVTCGGQPVEVGQSSRR